MSETTAPRRQAWPRRALHAAILSGGMTLAFCGTASAQYVFDDEVLPPRVIAWRLADRGFSGLSRPRYDGRVYVVEAVGPAGIPLRLFVDPMTGAVFGRQRLAAPETYARLERPAPGFGWTEEDVGPRRGIRPLPPAEAPAARPGRRPGAEAVRPPDANPYGVNPEGHPEGRGRAEPPRKVARTSPTRQPDAKPALRTTPDAPAPKVAPEAAQPAKPETPAASGKDAAPADSAKPAVAAQAEAARPAAKEWKDPPAEGKRPVRVIDGATIVPGTTEKDGAAAQ